MTTPSAGNQPYTSPTIPSFSHTRLIHTSSSFVPYTNQPCKQSFINTAKKKRKIPMNTAIGIWAQQSSKAGNCGSKITNNNELTTAVVATHCCVLHAGCWCLDDCHLRLTGFIQRRIWKFAQIMVKEKKGKSFNGWSYAIIIVLCAIDRRTIIEEFFQHKVIIK